MSSLPQHDQGAEAPRSTSCPQCGFDMEWGKPCRVCGYANAGALSGAAGVAEGGGAGGRGAAPGSKTPGAQPGKHSGTPLLALLLSAGGLLVVLAVFLLTSELQRQPAGSAAGNAAPVSQPAVPSQPEPAPQVAAAPQVVAAPEVMAAPPAAAVTEPQPAAAAPVRAAAPIAQPKPQPQPQPDLRPAGSTILSDNPDGFDITKRTDNPPFTNRTAFVDWMVKHTDQKAKFLRQRWDRAQVIVELGNITHERIREAFLRTPREYFCRDPRRAYENAVLPIGWGQTISGPHLVARMTDYLDPEPEQKVLEIGTGSGYQSAFLSEITNHVYTIEIVDALARQTDAIYRKLEPRYPEYRNIKRKVDDGYYGWEQYAPFDRIIVTCGIDHVPPALIRQLAPNGIMVIPVGPPSGQTILRIVKKVAADGTVSLEREDIYHGKKKQIFVPFTATGGGVHRADDLKD